MVVLSCHYVVVNMEASAQWRNTGGIGQRTIQARTLSSLYESSQYFTVRGKSSFAGRSHHDIFDTFEISLKGKLLCCTFIFLTFFVLAFTSMICYCPIYGKRSYVAKIKRHDCLYVFLSPSMRNTVS